MCVYMCIYIYMYIYIYMHAYIHIYIRCSDGALSNNSNDFQLLSQRAPF